MEEVFEFLKKAGTYFLATSEEGAPRVRPFGTILIYDGYLCLQTGKRKPVSRQMHADPRVELCAFADGTWLRVRAEAYEDARQSAQEAMLCAYPELRGMYAVGDGNTEIFRLTKVEATFSSFTAPSRTVRFS